MKTLQNRSATKWIAAHALLAMAAGTLSTQLEAQQVYRIVGPDGRVTFSDQPPPASSNAKVTTGVGSRAGTDGSVAPLPTELRSVVSKYPVTLYTSANCGPCTSGKAMLASRGVPFTEKTISTPEDSDSLKRLSGDTTLPFLTIGGQQLKGFSNEEWSQYLDAAGYPKTSLLPTSYRNPPASPLVAVRKSDPQSPDANAEPGAGARRQGANNPPLTDDDPPVKPNTNPAGIKF